MKSFSSLAAVIGLWLGVSFGLWLVYRLIRRRDHSRQRKLADDTLSLLDEGYIVFAALRKAPLSSTPTAGYHKRTQAQEEELLREDVRNLLNSIEAGSNFFDRVNASKKKVQSTFKLADFQPLSEILQIRRDFWAASEVFLMDDIRLLGAELADEEAYEAFRREARTLLFREDANPDYDASAGASQNDPVELRLAIAREEANAFLIEVDREIARQREQDRLPSAREFFAGSWQAIRTGGSLLRELRDLARDAAAAAQSVALAMTSKGLKGAAEELRKVRGDLPNQFAAAFERAGGLARQGGQGLKRHYEFLLEARELRARYAELLAKAPDLTEKGKQFLARLELEKRAEQFKETSEGALAWSRQQLVVGIAYLIAGLQYIQAKITPRENKQLVVRPAEQTVLRQDTAQREPAPAPIRVLLPPASFRGTKSQNGTDARRGTSSNNVPEDAIVISNSAGTPKNAPFRLRDLVTGGGSRGSPDKEGPHTEKPKAKKQAKRKARFAHSDGMMKTSFKDLLGGAEWGTGGDESAPLGTSSSSQQIPAIERSGSLLDRLSALGGNESRAEGGPENQGSEGEQKDEKKASAPVNGNERKSRFRIFGPKRV